MNYRSLTLTVLLGIFAVAIPRAQESVKVDGRLEPLLNEFIKYCKDYGIPYEDKLLQLKDVDIVDDLPLAESNTVLGKVRRDTSGEIDGVLINWAALLDGEILKVVAFHEFAHHFLDYKHTCQDCNQIMAVTNVSYFEISNDWENQVSQLFTTSPVFKEQRQRASLAVNGAQW